jgi:hypothetical protein
VRQVNELKVLTAAPIDSRFVLSYTDIAGFPKEQSGWSELAHTIDGDQPFNRKPDERNRQPVKCSKKRIDPSERALSMTWEFIFGGGTHEG